MDKQTQQAFALGGLKDEGGEFDEKSGNRVPVGGTKKGVRDDIPANVSEGEFIFPEDVTRYIGLENLMNQRQEAKMGLQKMDAMGQMGNGDEATMPDDMPFNMADLVVVGGQGEPMEFADGGFVPAQNFEHGGVPHTTETLDTAYVPTFTAEEVPDYESYMNSVVVTSKEYKNAEGESIVITFINGVPTTPIPEGYTLVAAGTSTSTGTVTPAAAVVNTVNTNNDKRFKDNDDPYTEPEVQTIDYNSMTPSQFAARMEYESSKTYQLGKGLGLAIASIIPLGGALAYAGMRSHARKMETTMRNLIKNAPTQALKNEYTQSLNSYLKANGLKNAADANILGRIIDGVMVDTGFTVGQGKAGGTAAAQAASTGTLGGQPVDPVGAVTETPTMQMGSELSPVTTPLVGGSIAAQAASGGYDIAGMGLEQPVAAPVAPVGKVGYGVGQVDPALNQAVFDAKVDAEGDKELAKIELETDDGNSTGAAAVTPQSLAGTIDESVNAGMGVTTPTATQTDAALGPKTDAGQRIAQSDGQNFVGGNYKTAAIGDGLVNYIGNQFDKFTGQQSVDELREKGQLTAQALREKQALKDSPDMFGPTTTQAPAAVAVAPTTAVASTTAAVAPTTVDLVDPRVGDPAANRYVAPNNVGARPSTYTSVLGGGDPDLTQTQQALGTGGYDAVPEGLGTNLGPLDLRRGALPVTSTAGTQGLTADQRRMAAEEAKVSLDAFGDPVKAPLVKPKPIVQSRAQRRAGEMAEVTSLRNSLISNQAPVNQQKIKAAIKDAEKTGRTGSTIGGVPVGKMSTDSDPMGVMVNDSTGKVLKLRDINPGLGNAPGGAGGKTVFRDAEGQRFVKDTFGRTSVVNSKGEIGGDYTGAGVVPDKTRNQPSKPARATAKQETKNGVRYNKKDDKGNPPSKPADPPGNTGGFTSFADMFDGGGPGESAKQEQDRGGGDGSSSKIVCSAMNDAYGFGSFRNKIWLTHSKNNLTKEHQVGYHRIFLPLINIGYKKNNKFVRNCLEHIARHRTTDIYLQSKGNKRDALGMVYRSILEPICYFVGLITTSNGKT